MRELAAELDPGVALVALGGYGRRELCPGSDVDLMVLHAERRADRIRGAAEEIFYPFWDAGLDLGHAVRTVDQCLRVADEDVQAATALLDARLVHGDAGLFAEMLAAVRGRLAKRPGAYLERLAAATEARHRAASPCSSSLEPDLKEGAGGLRDVVAIDWVLSVLGERDPVAAGLLRRAEQAALADAREFLVRLRSGLHLEAGRRADRLLLVHQPPLAAAFGFVDEPGLPAPDALMRTLFEHARQVEHVGSLFAERVGRLVAGEAEASAPAVAGPEAALALFAEAADSGELPGPAVLDVLEAAVPGEVAWTPSLLSSFLRVLAGPASGRALEAMDRGGLLARLIPEWAAVRCRPQRDPYHRFSVDRHLVTAVEEVGALLRGETGDDPLAPEAVAAVGDPDALLLGALLHDIGKRGEGRHVPVGAAVAGDVLGRLGVPEETAATASFLVAEHLLLSDTATRRDLEDENLILDVAGRVEHADRLAALYLLTVADARATGPHAWTPWRRALIRELVGKVQRALDRAEAPDRLALLADRLEHAAGLLADEDPERVAAFLDRLPRGYAIQAAPGTIARHFRLLEPRPGASEVRTELQPGPRAATHVVAVSAVDRPGLLAAIAGALTLAGLNILTAQAFTTEDGVALDLFTVEGAHDREVGEERWRRFRTDLRHAIEGRLALEHRVEEKRRHYRPPAPIPTEVTVDEDASDFFTVVEVSAADRIGLLFDLAGVFRDLELDVHVAKVATQADRVVDAFYVRDLAGRKVGDRAEEIRREVLARLG